MHPLVLSLEKEGVCGNINVQVQACRLQIPFCPGYIPFHKFQLIKDCFSQLTRVRKIYFTVQSIKNCTILNQTK